ncbi:unnamed protein product [Prunus armeniaca]|uniref:Uncharacterized protein n=1 Tax=Prunus armeniaca TaxID=36596 RepID=A0A6J5WQY1_PRUAR|nr:unnamed protein product [Prunus armeniaca]
MVPTHIKHSFDTISSLKLGDVIFLTWIKKGYIVIVSEFKGFVDVDLARDIDNTRIGLLAYDDGDVGCLRCGLVMCEVLEALAEFLGRYQVRGAHVQKPIGLHYQKRERCLQGCVRAANCPSQDSGPFEAIRASFVFYFLLKICFIFGLRFLPM